MKTVVAMDSFKGGLPAEAVCRAVAEGLGEVAPEMTIALKPMADGGEGTAAALLAARPGGKWVPATVSGPFPERKVPAGFAWFPEDGTAVVEMAVASGLPLVPEEERNPMLTSTFGTGELVRAAAELGARRILLTIGGSATVDGGAGAAAALGWRFLDRAGRPVAPLGGRLESIAAIRPPERPALPPVVVLSDVDNPLCGPSGAAAVFGPQKGAAPEMVPRLDAGLRHLFALYRRLSGRNLEKMPGAGAAGGLGAGAVAFMGAVISPGIEAVIGACGLREALAGADWCLTGEGSFDRQSLDGKVVSGVAGACREAGVPVFVLAGRVAVSPAAYRAAGIRAALAIHGPEMPLEEAVRREAGLLRAAAARWLRGPGGAGPGKW